MKVIKLTTPWTTNILYGTYKDPKIYNDQFPNLDGVIGEYKFEINNDVEECDYWIIWGGLNPGQYYQKAFCASENIFFLTDEPYTNREIGQQFLNQFGAVITYWPDLKHKRKIFSQELIFWLLKKNYTEIVSSFAEQKMKGISVVCSDIVKLEGHRKRFAFVNKLIGHFKDDIDVYGRGFKTIDDKSEALIPYKYSIAIENSAIDDYFTEKINECYLTNTVPIYYGCKNISNYYDSDSMIKIDVDDYKNSIKVIENLLEKDPYNDLISEIEKQKKKYLDTLHVYPALVKIIKNNFQSSQRKSKNRIYSEDSFKHYYHLRKMITIYNNRSFIPNKYKFDINFRS